MRFSRMSAKAEQGRSQLLAAMRAGRVLSAVLSAVIPFSVASTTFAQTPATPSASNRIFTPAELSPSISFAGIALKAPSPTRAPYRDSDDWVLCAPPEMLAPLGITFTTEPGNGFVTLIGPDGRASIQVASRTPRRFTSRSLYIPVVEAVEALGGKCQFDANTNTLHIRGVVKAIEMLGGQLRIRTTLPMTARVQRFKSTKQTVIDLPGAEIGDLPANLDLSAAGILKVRTGQFDDDTARVVLETKADGTFTALSQTPSQLLVFNPSYTRATPTPPTTDSAVTLNLNNGGNGEINTLPTRPAQPRAPVLFSQIRGLYLKNVKNGARLAVNLTKTIRPALRLEGASLILDLPGAQITSSSENTLSAEKVSLLESAEVEQLRGGTRIRLQLARALTYVLKPSDGGLSLELGIPRSATGTLAGKTIVVDPGHGGEDGGARGVDGSNEKNVNLKIGLALAEMLTEGGANVILTRNSDVSVPLTERARLANRVGADFFISVHSDSNDRGSIVNGSTVYYHMQVPDCRALAGNIARRLEAMGGIRTKGMRSDGAVYSRSGFAVLRESQMVGVLVECGYMTNPSDVANLNKPAMQRKIASAITAGLRDYISGNPFVDTRAIRPRGEDDMMDGESDAAEPSTTIVPSNIPIPALGDDRFFPDRGR